MTDVRSQSGREMKGKGYKKVGGKGLLRLRIIKITSAVGLCAFFLS